MRQGHIGNYSPGTVADISEALWLLSGCGPRAAGFETIGIAPLVESRVAVESAVADEAHGIDCYVDGFGSPLALGIFQKSEAFPDFIALLNSHGLFDNLDTMRRYCKAYSERAVPSGLEPIEEWREFCAYAVLPANKKQILSE